MKSFKRSIAITLSILSSVMLSSCGFSADDGISAVGGDTVQDGFYEPSDMEEEYAMTHSDIPGEDAPITVGFSQLGAESAWRSENTDSILKTLTTGNGFNLIYENGQQKQTNQITDIRRFIQQEVDYIVLAPVVETGWDTVLMEARAQGIPVILIDRTIETEDPELYKCHIGSDFELEAKKACKWLEDYLALKEIPSDAVHIAHIQGTLGASAQIGRTRGLERAAARNHWDIAGQVSGDFTEARGREVTLHLLRERPDINVIYCENDNMALGAIDALKKVGKKAGCNIADGEVMVISFDGTMKETMQLVLDGEIACIAQCNPYLGTRLAGVIREFEAGKEPKRDTVVTEDIYSGFEDIKWIEVDGKQYPVTIVTQTMIEYGAKWR